ncbi:hypothetical protein T310_8645, partial [Rasamsonia emersonii CBS 393.64]
ITRTDRRDFQPCNRPCSPIGRARTSLDQSRSGREKRGVLKKLSPRLLSSKLSSRLQYSLHILTILTIVLIYLLSFCLRDCCYHPQPVRFKGGEDKDNILFLSRSIL